MDYLIYLVHHEQDFCAPGFKVLSARAIALDEISHDARSLSGV
jgi:hypothetical protein